MSRFSSDEAEVRTWSGVRDVVDVAGREVVRRQVRIGGVS